MSGEQSEARKPFRVEEATIDELHAAIRAGETNCVAVVQHYIQRARAYNGVASLLVTGRRERPGSGRYGARRRAAALPDRNCRGLDDLP